MGYSRPRRRRNQTLFDETGFCNKSSEVSPWAIDNDRAHTISSSDSFRAAEDDGIGMPPSDDAAGLHLGRPAVPSGSVLETSLRVRPAEEREESFSLAQRQVHGAETLRPSEGRPKTSLFAHAGFRQSTVEASQVPDIKIERTDQSQGSSPKTVASPQGTGHGPKVKEEVVVDDGTRAMMAGRPDRHLNTMDRVPHSRARPEVPDTLPPDYETEASSHISPSRARTALPSQQSLFS